MSEHGLDLVVDPFHAPIADRMIPPAQDPPGMDRHRFGHALQLPDPTAGRQETPLLERVLHSPARGLVPDEAQTFLEHVPFPQRFVGLSIGKSAPFKFQLTVC